MARELAVSLAQKSLRLTAAEVTCLQRHCPIAARRSRAAVQCKHDPVSARLSGPLIGHGRDDVRAGLCRVRAGRYLIVGRRHDDEVKAGGQRVDAAVLV